MNRQLHDEGAALPLLPWVALGVERFCLPLRTADLTRGLIFLNAILHRDPTPTRGAQHEDVVQ